MAITDLTLLPSKYNNQDVIFFDDVFYIDSFIYTLEEAKNDPFLELSEDNLREMEQALSDDSWASSTTDKELEQCREIPSFLHDYFYLKLNDYADDSEQVELMKELIIQFKTPLTAASFCERYGVDEQLRQIVIDSKRPNAALFWCTHIENELVMRDIIMKSDDLFTIIDYSITLRGKDKEVEQLILNPDACAVNAVYYLERLDEVKRAEA